jgi:2-polyprenyl-6-methoxyphenol hydroxylase-like FAD-dependent oxidoreductase
MALEDAACLAERIASDETPAHIFAEYEARRIARTTKVTLASRRSGATNLTRTRLGMFRRDLLFQLFNLAAARDRHLSSSCSPMPRKRARGLRRSAQNLKACANLTG